jgi:hypothetical protein
MAHRLLAIFRYLFPQLKFSRLACNCPVFSYYWTRSAITGLSAKLGSTFNGNVEIREV